MRIPFGHIAAGADEEEETSLVQQKPKYSREEKREANSRRSWTEVLREVNQQYQQEEEAQDYIEVKDSDSEEVKPPCRPGASSSSGLQRASEEPDDPSSQAQQPEETPAVRPWKYAKAARAQ